MAENVNLYENIFNDKSFNDVIEQLTFNQFIADQNHDEHIKINFPLIKRSIWIASILAKSDNENHCRKVQLFAMLSHLAYKDNQDIERATFLLLARIGNLTASRHLPNYGNLYHPNPNEQDESFDALLDLELAIETSDKTLFEGDFPIILTRFQKDLWQKLNSNSNLSISAPTSAGKSFIIKQFIKNNQSPERQGNYIYIVPSRALINQVSEEFRKDFGEMIEIRTSFLEAPEVENKRNYLYVLTAERCLKLLEHAYNNDLKVNLIFTDEIQNIEDENGRGTILEFVLTELALLFPQAQIIIAGPNIINNEKLFDDIFKIKSLSAKTELSPVFQIKTVIRPLENESLQIIIKSLPQKNFIHSFENIGFDLEKRLKRGIGYALADLVEYFAPKQSNIIFCPRSDYAEVWARKSIKENIENEVIDNDTNQLIEFLIDEVHPDYFLINCLKQKMAFHHSKLPDIVRKEIEDGFLEGRITQLFCTSTLIEGVNLPASNLFIVSPKISNEPLSDFKFGNLIGRAGRLKDSLYGTIYCIEKNLDDTWAEEFYDKTYNTEVVSASDKAIHEHKNFEEQTLLGVKDIKNKRDKNTVILTRQKFIKNPDELYKYLLGKSIPESSINRIIGNTKIALDGIDISYDLTRKNPSIDPILQDLLYKEIVKNGIEKWCIHINKNFEARIKSEDVVGDYEDWSFFWQFADLLKRLDDIFNIWKEVNHDLQIEMSVKQMAIYAVRWTTGQSYKKLIREDINFMSKHTNDAKRIDPTNLDAINKRINTVIKINSIVVSHVLVKYIKLLNDLIVSLASEEQKEKFKFSLALPTMLELGTRSPEVHLLISRGVARSIAMKVYDIFQKAEKDEEINIIQWLELQQRLNLKPIYKKYLRNLKLISANA